MRLCGYAGVCSGLVGSTMFSDFRDLFVFELNLNLFLLLAVFCIVRNYFSRLTNTFSSIFPSFLYNATVKE